MFSDGLFGLLSNGISTTLIHPIDVVKTNFQLAQTHNVSRNVDRGTTNLNVRDIVRNVWKTRGVRGFYSGLSPNLCTYPIFWSVYFGTNQIMRDYEISENIYVDKFVKSYTAGLIGSGLTNPLFVLKTRMQNNNNSNSLFQTIRETNRLGFRSYYRGLGSTYLNNLKLAVQFPLYDVIHDKTDSVVISSFTAKTISSSLTYPLDLIRVNQRNSDTRLTIRETARNIYKRGGFRGLYRGIMLYNAVTTPNFVIMMVGYEMMKRRFL